MTTGQQTKESKSPKEKLQKLIELRAKCYACKKCSLGTSDVFSSSGKTPHVFSSGRVSSGVMLVGQNPGMNEVMQGKPFVGASGAILDRALAEAGIDRRSLFITNGVLCYTERNATPTDASVEACKEFLSRQIEIVDPVAILVLGKSAARSFNLGDVFSVAETRNTVSYTTPLHPRVFLGIHPAYTIYSGGKIDLLVDNLLKIKEYI